MELNTYQRIGFNVDSKQNSSEFTMITPACMAHAFT